MADRVHEEQTGEMVRVLRVLASTYEESLRPQGALGDGGVSRIGNSLGNEGHEHA